MTLKRSTEQDTDVNGLKFEYSSFDYTALDLTLEFNKSPIEVQLWQFLHIYITLLPRFHT
jgi:hypothetical protein